MKPRVRVRPVGRLWVLPHLPAMPGAFLIAFRCHPHAVALSVDGMPTAFVRLEPRRLPPHR